MVRISITKVFYFLLKVRPERWGPDPPPGSATDISGHLWDSSSVSREVNHKMDSVHVCLHPLVSLGRGVWGRLPGERCGKLIVSRSSFTMVSGVK